MRLDKELKYPIMGCPIGFGDCPDCIYYIGYECEYDGEEDEE